ncbi:Uma2 family endonuclease [Luteolibacter flavescens]|uniref:Uma2 family endonuclease n=1 Tax=Luteolibacter flavescens TaxID=1859460 RepID=A0ABT3FUP4_9BACT|nr:Uma2 family endonuclease [Luteolibacter flavescens]MCW1886924.1 Uma2 family endonuclease [Luteolibacter flavescens]
MTGLTTVADYLDAEKSAEGKHEFVGGFVFAMPSFSNRHNTIAGNAFAILHDRVRGGSFQAFNSSTKVRIQLPDHNRFYYPDAMVVCNPNALGDHFQDQPVVVIEVMSESTRRADLGGKRDAYLRISALKVLLLVEPDMALVTVHRRRAEGGFAVEHHHGLEASIPLAEIDTSLSLAELYDRAGIED